jgi:hypothetical protein
VTDNTPATDAKTPAAGTPNGQNTAFDIQAFRTSAFYAHLNGEAPAAKMPVSALTTQEAVPGETTAGKTPAGQPTTGANTAFDIQAYKASALYAHLNGEVPAKVPTSPTTGVDLANGKTPALDQASALKTEAGDAPVAKAADKAEAKVAESDAKVAEPKAKETAETEGKKPSNASAK